MRLQIHTDEHMIRIIVIKLVGSFDAYEVPRVRAEAERYLEENISHFVFDLSETTKLDSAGLAVMVSVLKRSRTNKGDVRLIWPESESTARILRLTKFDQVFTSITPNHIVPSGI